MRNIMVFKIINAVCATVMAAAMGWAFMCLLGLVAVTDGQPEVGCVWFLRVTVNAVGSVI